MWLLSGVCLFLLFVFGLSALRRAQQSDLPYGARKLFSPTEAAFFKALQEAVGPQFIPFAKVRVADLLNARGSGSAWRRAFNRIQSKHVDFVLCRPDLSVECAIELDDSSHAAESRADRDAFLNHAFKSAGIPLHRFKARSSYSAADIRASLAKAVASKAERIT
jgi:very-short-patch-repair endonuclease